jgi:cytochrome P450
MKLTVPTGEEPIDLGAVDLFDPHLYGRGDPHPIWHAMRERAPVHRQELPDGRGFWSVTKYADVNDVLRDHTRFTSSRGTLLSILGGTDPAGGKMMAATDPPRHGALREPLNRVLSHRALAPRQPQIKRIVHQLLAPLATGEPFDLAVAAAHFPMAFTGSLMGLFPDDWPGLTRSTTMAIAPYDPEFSEGSPHASLIGAHHELFEYFSDEVRARGDEPGDDLVGFLLTMTAAGAELSHEEIVYNCYSLLLGANVTTPHAFAGTVLALIENPDAYRRMVADPSLVTSVVEEGLRWTSPANHFMRYAVRGLDLRGVRIEAGDAVVAWLGSANRDAEAFDEPYRFEVDRSPNRHVAFGFGPHFCVGAPLARIALRMLFAEIVELVEEFQLAGPVEHLSSNFVAGIKHMPVTATLRPGAAAVLEAGAGTAVAS